MSTIILDSSKVKTFSYFQELGEYAGKAPEFMDTLWKGLIDDPELMKEYIYYLEHHTFLDQMKIKGYGLTDLYMWLFRQDSIRKDYGKNSFELNKEALVLDTFWHMTQMKRRPEEYVKHIEDEFGLGMDQI